MEVDHDEEDEHSGNQVGDVWQVATVEGLLECPDLVLSRYHQVDQRNQRSLELSAFSERKSTTIKTNLD